VHVQYVGSVLGHCFLVYCVGPLTTPPFPTSPLTWLGLGYNGLGEEAGRAIGQALALNPSFTRLNLLNNLVGDAVGRAIRVSWGLRPGVLDM
jgi:hypothetical protein